MLAKEEKEGEETVVKLVAKRTSLKNVCEKWEHTAEKIRNEERNGERDKTNFLSKAESPRETRKRKRKRGRKEEHEEDRGKKEKKCKKRIGGRRGGKNEIIKKKERWTREERRTDRDST